MKIETKEGKAIFNEMVNHEWKEFNKNYVLNCLKGFLVGAGIAVAFDTAISLFVRGSIAKNIRERIEDPSISD